MRRLGLVARFAILSALLIGVLGVVLARSIETGIRNRNLASARQTAVLVSRLACSHGSLPAGWPEAWHPPRSSISTRRCAPVSWVATSSRIKIWNRDLRIVYSDDVNLIGKRYPSNDEIERALDGETESAISNPSRAENAQDPNGDERLLEVYTPIRFAADQPVAGAFEIYLPYEPIAAGIHDDVLHLWVMLIAGLALLWTALFRFVLGASRRLQVELKRNEYQASHDPLTDLANRARLDEQTIDDCTVRNAEHIERASGDGDRPGSVQGRQRRPRSRFR